MSENQRQMHLGLSIQGSGYHHGAWRLASAPSNTDTNIDFYIQLAKIAEKGKFDMVFLADWLAIRENIDDHMGISRVAGLGRLEPITTLAAIATHTKSIGLMGTISTTFSEPYQVARVMASLDHISKGRAGWNVVTSWSDVEARNFGSDSLLAHPDRYARAREFVDVVFGLWDSWEPDAFIRDKASGVYLDPKKMHVLDHIGANFRVKGPLNMEPPPQRRPIISQAGSSEAGQELAAATADMIFGVPATLEAARKYYASVKGRLAKHGRHPNDLKILPGVMPIVGRTAAEAHAKYRTMNENISEELGLSLISFVFGDLRGMPLDEPIPNPPELDAIDGVRNVYLRPAHEGKTIREIYQLAAVRNWNHPIGSPVEIADYLEEWFTTGAADGFNLLFSDVPETAELFVELVVPELQRRGLFRKEYPGRTLRDNLGLAYPTNRNVE